MAVSVGQLLPKWQKLISLKESDTVEEAIEALRDNHLGSVPVCDANGKWLGYVGALDLVAGLVRSIGKDNKEAKTDAAEFEAFFHEANFRMKPLSEAKVIDLSERNPFVTLPASSSLSEAVGLIEKGIPRLAITEGLRVVGVLSQIDVVRFLDGNATKTLGGNADKSFAELSFLKPVKAVKVSASMFSAIVAMEREGVRSLAVVDNRWHLVAQLSPSDIMSVLPSVKFSDLNRPLLDYLPRLHDLVWKDKPVVRLPETATLAAGLRELISHGVHHLWITKANVPVGIVTLTDILQVFMRHLDSVALTKALTPKDAELVAKEAEARHKHDALEQRRSEWRRGTVSRKHLTDAHVHEPNIYLGPAEPKPSSIVELAP